MIYHITSSQAWQQAKQRGDYRADSLESEGFISKIYEAPLNQSQPITTTPRFE